MATKRSELSPRIPRPRRNAGDTGTTLVHYEIDSANPPPLTEAMRAELAAIAAMPDETIDLSDMPEVTDWSNWRRGLFPRPAKQQLTLRLDADIVHWFKAQAEGGGYQTRINQALRSYVDEQVRKVK